MSVFIPVGTDSTIWCCMQVWTPDVYPLTGFSPWGNACTTEALPWKLPPSDGVWYDIRKGGYGPSAQELHVGYLDSRNGNHHDPNPVNHVDLHGVLPLLGNGALPPYGWGASYKGYPAITGGTYLEEGYYTKQWHSTKQYYGYDNRGALVSNVKLTQYNTTAPTDLTLAKYPASVVCPNRDGICNNRQSTNILSCRRYLKATMTHLDAWLINAHAGLINSSVTYCDGAHDWLYMTNPDGIIYRQQCVSIRCSSKGYYEVLCRMYLLNECTCYENATNQLNVRVTWNGKPFDPFSHQCYQVVRLYTMAPGLTGTFNISAWNLQGELFRESRRVLNVCRLPYTDRYNEARSNAMSDFSELKSNWIENATGLSGSLSGLQDLVDAYMAYTSGNYAQAYTKLCGAYLWYKFAVSPSIDDYNDVSAKSHTLISNFGKDTFSNVRRRGRTFSQDRSANNGQPEWTCACTYHMTLKRNCLAVCFDYLRKLGLEPSFGQAWDLIPMSFVVDWFVPIGSFVRNVEDYLQSKWYFDIKYRIESMKTCTPLSYDTLRRILDESAIDTAKYGACSNLFFQAYTRSVYTSWGDFDPMAGQNLPTGISASQMLLGNALLAQFY